MPVYMLRTAVQEENASEALLDRVFFALSDPVRRTILLRLGGEVLLVSELAAPSGSSICSPHRSWKSMNPDRASTAERRRSDDQQPQGGVARRPDRGTQTVPRQGEGVQPPA
jgi:hypothetical protein